MFVASLPVSTAAAGAMGLLSWAQPSANTTATESAALVAKSAASSALSFFSGGKSLLGSIAAGKDEPELPVPPAQSHPWSAVSAVEVGLLKVHWPTAQNAWSCRGRPAEGCSL